MPSPKYVRPPPGGLASPVPAHRSPLRACAIAPIVWVFESGQTPVQLVPPSVVFQTPPPATAAKAELATLRSATTSVPRPPMLYGPSWLHASPLAGAAGSTAAACACWRLTCAIVTSELELSCRSRSSSGDS